MKKTLCALMALCLMLTLLPFGALAADASGEYGDGLRWSLTADGTLTITGRGAMPDYTQEELFMDEHVDEKPPVPWQAYDADLRAIVIGEGITHIGDFTFYDAQQVTSVTLPSTLRSIGKYAFSYCAAEAVANMFGKTLVTNQTGSEGKVVHKVYVTETVVVAREFYLSFFIDRDRKQTVLIASVCGGCDIETVAETHPEQVLTIAVDPLLGLQSFQARRVACLFQLGGEAFNECIDLILNLYRAFVASDACLIEINPLVLTKDGHLSALDCKMQLDDNARFRHENFASFDDPNEVDPTEAEARAVGIHNYVALGGDIACLANGAGLGLATIDLLDALGGKAANFLDIGDTASSEQKGWKFY